MMTTPSQVFTSFRFRCLAAATALLICSSSSASAAHARTPGGPVSVAATTTGVTSSFNPSVFGAPVTFTATVTTAGMGTPTGNVQFFDGPNPIGSPLALNASGQTQITTSALSVGSHTITAQYAGDVPNGFNASTGALNTNPQTVNKANTTTTLSSTANPVGTGVPVTFTATVNAAAPGAGTRTGTVTILRNGSPICSNVAVNGSGQATCTITFTVAGNYNVTAQYSGSGNFNASSTASPFVEQVVGPTAAGVSVSGRVLQGDGLGISRVRVTIADPAGNERFTLTNQFGYFRFADVPAGGTYIFTFRGKNYQTASAVANVFDNVADFNVVLTN